MHCISIYRLIWCIVDVLHCNYIDEATQKNGPGNQVWGPNMSANVDNASDKPASRYTMHQCQI